MRLGGSFATISDNGLEVGRALSPADIELVEREARTMPVFNPIMDNKVLGREIKRGIQIGEAKMLRLQIEARFGPIPQWVETIY